MNEAFHVDPGDGHFKFCPKCGLGSDVICCESCHMVSHPKCAAMAEIPDEEWHCHAWVVKNQQATTKTGGHRKFGITFAKAAGKASKASNHGSN
jgi:predicted amidophosphoribosyltransferase